MEYPPLVNEKTIGIGKAREFNQQFGTSTPKYMKWEIAEFNQLCKRLEMVTNNIYSNFDCFLSMSPVELIQSSSGLLV